MAKEVDQKRQIRQASRGRRDNVVGQVVSNKMTKTIAVEVFRVVKHDRYSKFVKRSSIFKAHDEKNDAKVGDQVRIAASRPLSKTKRWTLVEILARAGQQPEANV